MFNLSQSTYLCSHIFLPEFQALISWVHLQTHVCASKLLVRTHNKVTDSTLYIPPIQLWRMYAPLHASYRYHMSIMNIVYIFAIILTVQPLTIAPQSAVHMVVSEEGLLYQQMSN